MDPHARYFGTELDGRSLIAGSDTHRDRRGHSPVVANTSSHIGALPEGTQAEAYFGNLERVMAERDTAHQRARSINERSKRQHERSKRQHETE